MDPYHTSYSGISMTRERTFAPAGFAIGIVTVLDSQWRKPPFRLLSTGLKSSTVGSSRASSQNRTAASTALGSGVIAWAGGGA
jgi:hypothetical protein